MNEKRFKFDPSNIPGAVKHALSTEYADMSEAQKRLVIIERKNMVQALTAGYQFNADMGRSHVEDGFFVQYRRIYSTGQSDSLSSSGSSNVAAQPNAVGRLAPRVLFASEEELELPCVFLVGRNIVFCCGNMFV